MNIARSIIYSTTFSFGLMASSLSAATVDAGDIIANFGLIVLNDLTASSETEVAVYVGGDVQSNGYTVNSDGVSDASIGGATGSFIVGGTVYGNNTINVDNGDAAINQLSGGITIVTNNGDLNTGVSVPSDDVTDAFQQLSLDLAAEVDTAGVNLDTADQNIMTIDGGSDSIAVLNVTDTYANFLQSGTLTSVSTAGTLIVNIPGTSITIGANANSGSSNVLFNFYEATSIQVNSTFDYGILAPLADITLQSGGTNTTVVGYNVTQMTEVRGSFTGTLPTSGPSVAPVPLPASGVLLMGALAGTAALRRRKAKAAA